MGFIEEAKEIITLSKEAGISLAESIDLYKSYKKNINDSSEAGAADPKKEEPPKKTEEPENGKEQPEQAPEKEETKKDPDNVIDYKKKVEELEKKLENLQQENRNKDVSDSSKKTDEDIINDITRSFM